MGRKIITYWKTDGERLAFYNILDVILGLGSKPVTSIPLEEWMPVDDRSSKAEWKAFKQICYLMDNNNNLSDGSYFTCRDNSKKGKDLDYTYVTVSETLLDKVVGDDTSIRKFKLKRSNLWCVECTMEPEQIIQESDDDDEDGGENWK